jgi:hypothetical protein
MKKTDARKQCRDRKGVGARDRLLAVAPHF